MTRRSDSTPTDRASAATEGATMSLNEHLAELRSRIIRSVLAVLVGAVLIIAFYDQVLNFLVEPYRSLCERQQPGFCDGELFIMDPIEGLATRLRVATYGGVLLALPVILWQVWRFIVPALHARERRYAVPFIISSVVLFALGAVVAYYTLGRALEFLISWSGEDVGQVFRVSSYLGLAGVMGAAFGVGFLLPVLLVFLQLVGVVSPRRLLASWRYAILAIVVLAAFMTPSGDPISLAMLSVPMLTLYFIAVLIGWLLTRRRTPLPPAS